MRFADVLDQLPAGDTGKRGYGEPHQTPHCPPWPQLQGVVDFCRRDH